MSITPEQAVRLNNSFHVVSGQLDRLIELFYERLFAAAPSVRAMFPASLEGQRRHMTQAVLLVAQNMEQLENLREPLVKMGEAHDGYGAQEDHFPVVRDAMIQALAHVTGPSWNDVLAQDWRQALDTVSGFMIEGLRARRGDQAA